MKYFLWFVVHQHQALENRPIWSHFCWCDTSSRGRDQASELHFSIASFLFPLTLQSPWNHGYIRDWCLLLPRWHIESSLLWQGQGWCRMSAWNKLSPGLVPGEFTGFPSERFFKDNNRSWLDYQEGFSSQWPLSIVLCFLWLFGFQQELDFKLNELSPKDFQEIEP